MKKKVNQFNSSVALNRLTSWTEGDKQNIWELSGQFEGDILLEPDSKNGVVNARRWNNREMPYEIDSRYSKLLQNALY